MNGRAGICGVPCRTAPARRQRGSGDEVLDAVLREYADGVLRLGAEIEEGIAGLLHKSGEATIAHGLPYRTAEILIREGFALSILLCLLKGEN